MEVLDKSGKTKCMPISLRYPPMLLDGYEHVYAYLHSFDALISNHLPLKAYDHFFNIRIPILTCFTRRRPYHRCHGVRRNRHKYAMVYIGQSSPRSSVGSLTYSSSRTSSSSLSPPSSQSSIADLSVSPPPFIRPQPRIQVSSLLSDPQSRSYHLEIVQHPLRTAEFGAAYLSRIPLTPPVVARLTVRDSSGNSVIPESELPFLIAHLSLYSGDGSISLDRGSFIGRGMGQQPPPLYGHLVSTVEQLEDLQGNMGLFFLFPDVSIRQRGRYQLGVTLTRINSPHANGLAERGTFLAQARTRSFEAVALREYVAEPQTPLTRNFIRQGARMFANSQPYVPRA